MLGNCEKMVAIPPTTTSQCPQPRNEIDFDGKVSMGFSGRVMEKASQELLQQQQQLKCPRCDSSNTKFCYYNNYSLSQPRHFCKACKRYWTRGGTLRNVPVGGGCRRNKRVIKRPTSSAVDTASSSSSSAATTTTTVPSATPNNSFSQPQIDTASTSNHVISPLFYGLSNVNLPFSGISSSGYDLQPQMNATGLGFSSSHDNGYGNGFTSYGSIFRSSSSTSSSSTPVMIPSNLLQHKFINHGLKDVGPPDGTNNSIFHGLASLEQMQSTIGNSMKGEVPNRLEWNNNIGACQNQIEHVGLFDPSLYWNTASAIGVWNDQANNIGPSVTSLI